MSTRRSTWFYGLLIVLASVMVGMVLASRLDMTTRSAAQTLSTPAANSAPLSGPVDATTFRNIAKAVTPTVVNIRTESRQRAEDLSDFFGGGGGDDLGDLFPNLRPRGRGQQAPQQPREEKVRAAGTGFIIDKAGLILTNNHVVDGANKIMVSLYGEDDDQEYAARVVGQDPLTDSALIELTEKPNHLLPEIKFGDSSQMQPGDWVMAIGNPFGFSHTVSVGVVSGIGREFAIGEHRNQRVIQTDAAINPGNSGGPLLNLRGEVIGINTAIYADQSRQGNIGIGFAMPINLVRDVLPQLRTGKISRGRIGIELTDVKNGDVKPLNLKAREGALVSSVIEGSAAEKAGVDDGDVILSFNGKAVHRSDDLVAMVTATKPGTTVPMRLVRNGAERSVNITVDELDYNAENRTAQRERQVEPQDDHQTSRGFGIDYETLSGEWARRLQLKDTRGAMVRSIDVDGPAAGVLNQGDVIVQIGAQPIANAADANRELNRVTSGSTVIMRIMRDGRRRTVTLVKE
jgi:serine protease Do